MLSSAKYSFRLKTNIKELTYLPELITMSERKYDQHGKIMRKDISKEIQRIAAQIIEKYKPDKIILFGSAARNELKEDSDLDFLIIKRETPLYGADRIRQLSRMIDRDISVDFLVYRPEEFDKRLQMGDPFIKLIAKEGKVLYG